MTKLRHTPMTHATAFLRRAVFTVVIGVALTIFSTAAHAQSISGTLNATLTISSACRIVGNSGTSGLNFGTLSFGTAPSTFTGQLSAQATGGVGGPGNTQLICSPDITGITVTIDGGQNAGQGSSIGTGTRAMAINGPSYMPYEIYSNVGHTTAYPIGAPGLSVTVSVPGTAFDLPIYGLVNKTSSSASPMGGYQYTLTVTVAW
jgi:spore coat protein U-like protein